MEDLELYVHIRIATYADTYLPLHFLTTHKYICVYRLFLFLNFAVNSEKKTTRNTVSIEVESIEGQQIL